MWEDDPGRGRANQPDVAAPGPVSGPRDLVEVRNRCAIARIEPMYAPLIEAAKAAVIDTVGPTLVELRLQGSVARGEAAPGRSDLDLMAVLSEPAAAAQASELAVHASQLGERWPLVSRVELEAVAIAALIPFQRFVLASDSLSLVGDDTLTVPVAWWPRADLARLITPEPNQMLSAFRDWIADLMAHPDAAELAFASRIIGKDLLKGYRAAALRAGAPYAVRADTMAGQITRWVPEFALTAERLSQLTRTPPDHPQGLLELLETVERELAPTSAWLQANGAPASR